MLLTETQILPPLPIFILAKRNNGLLIEKHENYQKKSLRNRFYLASHQGRIEFSIPLKKGKSKQTLIDQVGISYDNDWIKDLQNMIATNYGRAAFFEYYFHDLIAIFKNYPKTLWELNQNLLLWVLKTGHIDLEISQTISFQKEYKKNILDFRSKPLSFYNIPTSKNYMVYDQIFMIEHGFIRNLSILDLIMNRGPESGLMIERHLLDSY